MKALIYFAWFLAGLILFSAFAAIAVFMHVAPFPINQVPIAAILVICLMLAKGGKSP